MYPQGVCRIRKPAYARNGCAIFLVFRTEEVGQKDGCGSQTRLRGVAIDECGIQRNTLFPLCSETIISKDICPISNQNNFSTSIYENQGAQEKYVKRW